MLLQETQAGQGKTSAFLQTCFLLSGLSSLSEASVAVAEFEPNAAERKLSYHGIVSSLHFSSHTPFT